MFILKWHPSFASLNELLNTITVQMMTSWLLRLVAEATCIGDKDDREVILKYPESV
jgi:hypothetical protein